MIWFWSLLQFKGYIYLNLSFHFKFASTFMSPDTSSSTSLWCHFINFWGHVLIWCHFINFWGHVWLITLCLICVIALQLAVDPHDAIQCELKHLNCPETKPEAHWPTHLKFLFLVVFKYWYHLWEKAGEGGRDKVGFSNPDSWWKGDVRTCKFTLKLIQKFGLCLGCFTW